MSTPKVIIWFIAVIQVSQGHLTQDCNLQLITGKEMGF